MKYVPKSPVENIRWRIKMRRAALHDLELREALYDAAMQDVLFFFNAFCWVMEPRGSMKVKPFVTWPHQDPVILKMDQAISDAEKTELPIALTVPKSRAQGATYAYICVFERRFIRDPLFSAGVVTRNEKLVDSATDKNTILWKIDWELQQLPTWFLPGGYVRSLTDHTITNPENGAQFTGFAATGDVSRGGRETVFALDEFGSEEFIAKEKDYKVLSSISHVTNCMLLVSTFGDDSGAFYEAATDPENTRKVVLDWKDNPFQTKNAYVMREGILVPVRPEEGPAVAKYAKIHAKDLKTIARRGHLMEGKFRSPWYDAYCLLPGATPRFIARELDMDPRGAVGKLFNSEVLRRMLAEKTHPPIWQGRPAIVDEKLRLNPQDGGPLKLWFKPGLADEPPRSRFVVGTDSATGSGGPESGNSAMIGVDCRTGEQILEYVDRTITPTRFARLSVAVCRWLNEAELIWESTGPTGLGFWKEVDRIGYGNIWRNRAEHLVTHKVTDKPGWANTKTSDKATLFEHLWVAMDEDFFTPRSEDLIKECGGWEWDEKTDKIIYRGTGHGDRVIAGGLCWKAIGDLRAGGIDTSRQPAQTVIRYGTLAWRMEQSKAVQRRGTEEDGEGYGLRELLGMSDER